MNSEQALIPIGPENTREVQDFILELWTEFFDAGPREVALGKRKDLQDPAIFYKNHNGNFWCLRKNGEIMATIAVHEILFEGQKVGFLRRFFIEKQNRNKGLGSKMLKFVENYCLEKGWIFLMFGVDESMESNKGFYAKHGYEEFTENVPQEILDDMDNWYLRKKLT